MAANFRISTYRSGNNLHLNLAGDFDGSSAFELINFLKESFQDVTRVIVHTDYLRNICSFGRETFQRNFSDVNADKSRISFTGKNAEKMVSERSLSL